MKRWYRLSFVACLLFACSVHAQSSFSIVPLGVRGGLDESNLSAYLVAKIGRQDYISMDAGTIYAGVQKAVDLKTFHGPVSEIIRRNIRAYFISHPHLDHCAGLIMNAPDDTAKNIYGLAPTLQVLQDKYFSWASWANFGDAGEKPQLRKYHYVEMQPGTAISVESAGLTVTAFELSHGEPYRSTAFLVGSGDASLLYLGDTGADTIEHAGKLKKLWESVAPLVRAKQLKAIFIEVSFRDEQPDKQLFGHLTPRLLMQELTVLAQLAGDANIKGLPIVITHRKPNRDAEALIARQLQTRNTLGVKLVFPRQGIKMSF